jgi:proteic killer suppression protein
VIVSFAKAGTDDVFHGRTTKAARRVCPSRLWAVARRKLDQLNAVVSLTSLRVPPGNRLESLRGDRAGQFSIRINDQFRICFDWTDAGPADVEIADYHRV